MLQWPDRVQIREQIASTKSVKQLTRATKPKQKQERTTMAKETTAVATISDSFYPALSEEAVVGIKEAMDANLGGDSIDPRKLFSTIKMPSGGSTAWEIPAIEGEDFVTKEFTGIIMHIGTERAKYVGKYGENKVPECTSQDGVFGIGEPGGECMRCHYNQFDTHEEHKGRKGCSEVKMVYFIMKNTGQFEAEEWPMIMRVSAGSFGVLEDYRIKLAKSRIMIHSIETKFTLIKTKNKQDIDFAQMVMTRGEKVADKAMLSTIAEYKKGILPYISTVVPVIPVTPSAPVITPTQGPIDSKLDQVKTQTEVIEPKAI